DADFAARSTVVGYARRVPFAATETTCIFDSFKFRCFGKSSAVYFKFMRAEKLPSLATGEKVQVRWIARNAGLAAAARNHLSGEFAALPVKAARFDAPEEAVSVRAGPDRILDSPPLGNAYCPFAVLAATTPGGRVMFQPVSVLS